jgi:hypothetical protein
MCDNNFYFLIHEWIMYGWEREDDYHYVMCVHIQHS